jgi:Ras-related GTP-binding protein A/B
VSGGAPYRQNVRLKKVIKKYKIGKGKKSKKSENPDSLFQPVLDIRSFQFTKKITPKKSQKFERLHFETLKSSSSLSLMTTMEIFDWDERIIQEFFEQPLAQMRIKHLIVIYLANLGYTYSEIEKKTGVKENTIKSIMHRHSSVFHKPEGLGEIAFVTDFLKAIQNHVHSYMALSPKPQAQFELSEKVRMRLTPYILARAGQDFKSLLLETVQGEYKLDIFHLKVLISRLQKIYDILEIIHTPKQDLKQLKNLSLGKIILLGLSQAGKTSIRDVVFGGKAPEETADYKATINYEKNLKQTVDGSVTVMDLGGQEVFLKRFLSSMSSFIFSNVAVLVYICDISTPDKFPASLKVFVEGINRLEEMSDVQPAVYILLHKTDLMSDLTQRTERMQFLMEMFQDAVVTKNITFLQTSIYDNSIHEAFKRITAEASEIIPGAVEVEEEEDLEAIQRRLRLRPIQQVLHALKFMNRLDEVLLLSTIDPEFIVSASEADGVEIQQFLTIIDKSEDLWLIPGSRSELVRVGEVMLYKVFIPPHYLILLISSTEKSMLETKSLQEIEETVLLLSNQLTTMLKSPA